MANLRVIALEDEETCRAVSIRELDSIGQVWTVDSRLIRNIEGIAGTLGIDLPTDRIVEKLGKHIEPAIPLPRVLGSSKNPFHKMDIVKIQIYPEERAHRVDICWEKKTPGRWFPISRYMLQAMTSYSRMVRLEADSILITWDRGIASGCPNYDLVVWRNCYLILPDSGVPDLLNALGMSEKFAHWLGLLIDLGEIPLNERPILREQLIASIGAPGEELLNRLSLPYERRFGDPRGTGRDYHFFSFDW